MKKTNLTKLTKVLSGCLAVLSIAIVQPASMWLIHQPKTPKVLK